MIKLVVFDLDGVLIDSKKAYVDVIYNVLKKNKFKFTKRNIEKALGAKMIHTLKNLQNFSFLDIRRISNKVHEAITEKVVNMKICPHVKTAVKALKKEKVKIALLTNSRNKYANAFLKKHKISRYFDLVLGGDQFRDKKDVFKRIYRELKVKQHEVLYVGDRTGDVSIARNVG